MHAARGFTNVLCIQSSNGHTKPYTVKRRWNHRRPSVMWQYCAKFEEFFMVKKNVH